MDAQQQPSLILEVKPRTVEVSAAWVNGRGGFRMGIDDGNDLVHGSTNTSRFHAYIEFKHNDFYLVDESTNGTYVQTEDEQVFFIHRDKLRLWGSGFIALGEPLNVAKPILFRQQ